ncbi:MAG: radical SAM protein [Acutalibacteraceae bacterium]
MKNVYLIQPNNLLPTSVYLPYSVGCLAAYSFSHDIIKQNYHLSEFIFTQDPIEEVLNKLNEPAVAGFSCYIWNVDYNLSLAEAIKIRWPDCLIVFGGPQIPNSTEYITDYSFIDITIFGEGEIPFYEVLIELLKHRDWSKVNNIAYRKNNQSFMSEKVACGDLSDFPSPYAMGLFDNILADEKYKSMHFDVILETNRGCPYGCIYCYWARSGTNFRKYPMERVKKDIDWMARHKIPYCFCADANFGILERDEEIADYVIESKKNFGYPERFVTMSAKNKDDVTFRINQKLEKSGLNKGVCVAVQSMSPKTLEIIGRKNMSINNLSYQLKEYRENNIDTYTDLILGLPGETLESFCKGIFEVIEAGQHNSVNVFCCEVFPNTVIHSDKIQKKYQIKTIRSQLCQYHSKISKDSNDFSRSQIVVETSTMTTDEWKTALKVATMAQSFHCLGLLRFFAVYLRKAKNVSYYDFYSNLYRWIAEESKTVKSIFDKTFRSVEPFLKGKGNLYFADERFGDIYWAFDEGLFLSCVAEFEPFYGEIKTYLNDLFDDETIFEDLFHYQKEMICLPGKDTKEIRTAYDWYGYFERIFDDDFKTPEKKKTLLKIEASTTDTWEKYAREIVWYGRRSGKMINSVKERILL